VQRLLARALRAVGLFVGSLWMAACG